MRSPCFCLRADWDKFLVILPVVLYNNIIFTEEAG